MNASENVPWLLLDVKFTSISNHPGSNRVIIILCRQKGKHQWTMFAELILEFWLGQHFYNVMTQVLNFRILPYDSIKMYVYFTTIWWPGDPVPWCTGRITWMGGVGWPQLHLLTHLHLISPRLDGKCNNKHCRSKAPMTRAKSVSCVIWVQTWLNLYSSKCQPEWKSIKKKYLSYSVSNEGFGNLWQLRIRS